MNVLSRLVVSAAVVVGVSLLMSFCCCLEAGGFRFDGGEREIDN